MSKNLTIIQKCAHVFRILVRVGLILSILGLVFGAAAALLWAHWNNMPASGIDALDSLMAVVDKGSYYRTLGTLIADAVACAISGLLLWFAHSYLTHELADGTPFTDNGATELRRLGVLTIVLPLAGLIVRAIPYAAFDMSAPYGLDNASSVILGVVLIIASVVFRYGAELAHPGEEMA